MSGLDIIKQNRIPILAAATRYGAEHLRVFGSVIRHEERPDSDIDFLVTMQPGHDLLDLIALGQELEALLHKKTDIVSENALSPYLKDRILHEAVAI